MKSLIVSVCEVAHGSERFLEAVELRDRVLRAPLGLSFSPETLAAEASDTHLVAVLDDTVVGTLLLTPIGPSVMKMRQVAIEPAHRGLGIGSELVRASESLAKGRGVNRFELHARHSAVSFYIRLGYQAVGEPFLEVGIPHCFMCKSLTPVEEGVA